jgi:hypothetical protein
MLKKSSQVEAVQKTWDMNTVLKNYNFCMIFTMTQYQNVKRINEHEKSYFRKKNYVT